MVKKGVKNYIEWCSQRTTRLEFCRRYDDIVHIVYIAYIVYIYIVYILDSSHWKPFVVIKASY